MKRYGLVLLVLVLAATSLLAAAAYNTASVTNAATLKIQVTNMALLSVQTVGGIGNLDGTASYSGNELRFDFGKGAFVGGTSFHGLQPNSVYEWTELFQVNNKSLENLTVTVTIPAALQPFVEVAVHEGHYYTPSPNAYGFSATVSPLGSDCRCSFKVRVTIPSGTSLQTITNAPIIVSAVAIP